MSNVDMEWDTWKAYFLCVCPIPSRVGGIVICLKFWLSLSNSRDHCPHPQYELPFQRLNEIEGEEGREREFFFSFFTVSFPDCCLELLQVLPCWSCQVMSLIQIKNWTLPLETAAAMDALGRTWRGALLVTLFQV
jgi:hypothetical protein